MIFKNSILDYNIKMFKNKILKVTWIILEI